ncbi:hypothetical protein ACFOTA_15300 [Chitinophaga sp. GCM10012297]|uniref:Uncharacterized protein n=1 Tax=Chitinophaga chungangae TaxID=2821488 RepID=A0ABS3YFX1_9BACT|nr:hypothetical protein [Chitinophaga chungangae]MBO9153586.1 hypothetical protein [Chitinophaga chungangae]
MKKHFYALCAAAFLMMSALPRETYAQAKSEWAYFGPGGKLAYKTLEKGDRIPDFSYAGYMGGGVPIPSPVVTITLDAQSGGNAAAIQQAVDELSKRSLVNGFRGVLLLKPGVYNCDKTINITASGIVIRGSGNGEKGTVLNLTGAPHTGISVRGGANVRETGFTAVLTDAYVPVNASVFHLSDTKGLAVGDVVRISRPVTPAWVHFMGMDSLVRDGKKQIWITGDITVDRVIAKIEGKKVTVTLPLTDNYDAAYLGNGGVRVSKIISGGEIEQVGLENFRIVSPTQSGTISEGHHKAFTIRNAVDAWARNIEALNTMNSISVSDAKRVTLDRVNIRHETPSKGAAKPADLNGSGSQILFNRCNIQGDNVFYFATGAKVSGPIVLLHCTFTGNGWIQPHQRWATAVLVDNCNVPTGGIDFMNRGVMGSGHGWSIGWAVAWNCKAKTFLNQQPPGSANWVIGSEGERTKRAIPFDTVPYLPEGIFDSHGKPVAPSSLYLAQLAERLGKGAVKNIGY